VAHRAVGAVRRSGLEGSHSPRYHQSGHELHAVILGDISGRTSSEIVADLAPERSRQGVQLRPDDLALGFLAIKAEDRLLRVWGRSPMLKRVVSGLIDGDRVSAASISVPSRMAADSIKLGGPLLGVNLSLVDRFVPVKLDRTHPGADHVRDRVGPYHWTCDSAITGRNRSTRE